MTTEKLSLKFAKMQGGVGGGEKGGKRDQWWVVRSGGSGGLGIGVGRDVLNGDQCSVMGCLVRREWGVGDRGGKRNCETETWSVMGCLLRSSDWALSYSALCPWPSEDVCDTGSPQLCAILWGSCVADRVLESKNCYVIRSHVWIPTFCNSMTADPITE